MRRCGQLVAEADEDRRPARGRATQQQLVDQRQHVFEARLAAIETAGVVHRRVAALDDGRETGTQHVCESLGLFDTAAPDRIQDRVGVGDLLQHVGDVLRGADRFAARIDPDIPPGLDDRHALAEDLRHLQQESQVVRALDHLFERWRDAPVEESLLREHVAPWEGRWGIAVAQEVAEQGMHGLWTRRVQPEDARSYSPAEVLECEALCEVHVAHSAWTKQGACQCGPMSRARISGAVSAAAPDRHETECTTWARMMRARCPVMVHCGGSLDVEVESAIAVVTVPPDSR